MASFDHGEALAEILPGLFKAYTSGQGSLAPFFQVAPLNSHRSSNGTYQVRDTRFGYSEKRGNVGKVSAGGATRGVQPINYSEVAIAMEQFATDWVYVDDRTREALIAGNSDLDAATEALDYVSDAMGGFLYNQLHTAIDSLSAYGTTLALGTASLDLVEYFRTYSDTVALAAGPRYRPNVFAFGPTVYNALLALDQVREAGKNLGSAYPTKGIADGEYYRSGRLEVAPALRAVLAEAGITPVLIDESYENEAGSQAWQFNLKGFCGHAAPGRRPSCLKIFSPYDELIKVVTGRLAPPYKPGDAYMVEAEYQIKTVDSNLGNEITITV
jgi:hypothetical protein